jgi:hypothetical protein
VCDFLRKAGLATGGVLMASTVFGTVPAMEFARVVERDLLDDDRGLAFWRSLVAREIDPDA